MKVLVCGGRTYADRSHVWRFMSELHRANNFTEVIHGAATGADMLAGEWAKHNGIKVTAVPAQWRKDGKLNKAAGYIRNRQMLGLKPDMVVAFPGGRGTENMVRLANEAQVPVVSA